MGSIGPQKSGRVNRDGAFTNRRGPGDGFLQSPRKVGAEPSPAVLNNQKLAEAHTFAVRQPALAPTRPSPRIQADELAGVVSCKFA